MGLAFFAFGSWAQYDFDVWVEVTDPQGNPVSNQEVFFYSIDMAEQESKTTNNFGICHIKLWSTDFTFPEVFVYTWAFCDSSWQNYVDHFTAYSGYFEVELEICNQQANPNECKADFQSIQISPYLYGHLNTSLGQVDSVQWRYGQSEVSTGDSLLLLFDTPGLHDVEMHIFGSTGCRDSITHTIPVGLWDYINGRVSLESTNLPSGWVYVYQQTGSVYENLWTKRVRIENGSFEIPFLFFNNYYLQAIPEIDLTGTYFPKYLPTYYGGSNSWGMADTLQLFTTPSPVQINLSYYSEMYYGEGSISGQVERYDSIKGSSSNYFVTQNIRPPVFVFLLDEESNYLDYHFFEEGESFMFDNLPLGSYTLRVEKFGENPYDLHVVLSEENSSVDDILFLVNTYTITIGIETPETNKLALKAYPIPASDWVVVEIPDGETGQVELFDSKGSRVKKTSVVSEKKIYFDFSKHPEGLYLLRFTNDDGAVVSHKIPKN